VFATTAAAAIPSCLAQVLGQPYEAISRCPIACAADWDCVGRLNGAATLRVLLHPLDDALHRLAGLPPSRLPKNLKDLFQTLDRCLLWARWSWNASMTSGA